MKTQKRGASEANQEGAWSLWLFLLQVSFAVGLTFTITTFYNESGNLSLALPITGWLYILLLSGNCTLNRNANARLKINILLAVLAWFAVIAFVLPYNSPFLLVNYLLIYITITKYSSKLYAFGGIAVLMAGSYISVSLASSIDTPRMIMLIAHYILLLFFSALGIQVTKLAKRKEQELIAKSTAAKVQEERLHSLINSMRDAVIATDEQGIIAEYNAAALNLINLNEDIKGKKIQELLAITDAEKNTVDVIEQAKQANRYMTSRDYVLKQEDEEMNLYISVAPVSVSYGKSGQRGFIMVMRDITDEKSLEEERDEFISVVSHELRTPITITEAGISNAIIMYEKDPNNPKIRETLEESHEQVVFLANMMNDLSTLSRAQRNNLNIELATVNPNDIIQELHDQYKDEVEKKGLKLNVVLADNISTIITSKLYLDEILQNFITNAAKYTKEGSITVSVTSDKRGATFSVSDTGIGISTSDQQRLFDKFFRSEDYRTRETGGTGLGLYISLKLARRMNAKITFQSVLNQGSTFSVTVPPVVTEDVDKKQMAEVETAKVITEV